MVDRGVEAIAGPLVAEVSAFGATVPAPLDPLSDRTLMCVTLDRSIIGPYNALASNGVIYTDGRLQLRTSSVNTNVDCRFDGRDGDTNKTSVWTGRGTGPTVQGAVLDMQNLTVVSTHDGGVKPGKTSIGNAGKGITTQVLSIPSSGVTLWAGLWPRVLTDSEVRQVSEWLKSRWL